ncbi:histone-lysine N-methyltransferase SETMAR [Plakobranchus ocellatus]|uniref:Histone-lysine N-methyltransferase SETMAR n=1 Tax=Plakobranchus ocellatus TaxID=259542 RepID=A0AAV4CGN3_9GAST|nr:histone-lysine N-methyltransferase SETMAR [Plakobranchus ocellatus]
MEYGHKTSPSPRKFKVVASARKVLFTVFWDMEGVVHMEFLEQEQTVNSERYISTLRALKLRLRRVWRDKDSILQYDRLMKVSYRVRREFIEITQKVAQSIDDRNSVVHQEDGKTQAQGTQKIGETSTRDQKDWPNASTTEQSRQEWMYFIDRQNANFRGRGRRVNFNTDSP